VVIPVEASPRPRRSTPPHRGSEDREGQVDEVSDRDTSQTWRTFLDNHVRDLVSLDFFTVSTAGLRVLFVLVVLAYHRRRIVHFNVAEHPTAHWTAQQLVDAFPDDSAPSYSLHDRDQVYGEHLRRLLRAYVAYYNSSRRHQALENNSPIPREVQPPSRGQIRAVPEVGRLHHRYQRVA
jgi:putative transposase